MLKCCDMHLAKLLLEKFLGYLYNCIENSGRQERLNSVCVFKESQEGSCAVNF